MKDFLNCRISKLVLLALLAVFAGGVSPAWAQKALPYTYGFENNDLAAEGWTIQNGASGYSGSTGISSSAKYNGSYGFDFLYSTNPPQYLISPELATSSKTLDISFWYRAYNTYNEESFKFGYSSTTNDVETAFTWEEEIKTTSTTWTEYTVTIPAGTKYVAIQYTANNKYHLYIDDINIEETPTCFKPTDLAATDITSSSVQLSWTSDGDEWNVQYKKATDADWTDVSGTVTSKPYTLTGLASGTAYQVRVRTYCDASDQSAWTDAVSFSTPQEAVSASNFTDDFEGSANWAFSNGSMTNAWAIGSATNNGGSNAMYISNDGGTTYAYTPGAGNTVVYATKLFTFAAGKYDVSFDWKGSGESNYDFMRVGIAPSTLTLTASTTIANVPASGPPTGWTVALDGGGKLNQSNSWQTQTAEVTIETAGDYFVVFAWRNDGSGGTSPAAAVDNFSIAFQACPKPTGAAISDITKSSATLTWDAVDDTSWEVYVSTESEKPASNATATAGSTSNSYQFTSLDAETTYYAWVRAVKGSDKSDWVGGLSFTTLPSCITPTAFAASNVTTNSATLTWTDETEQSKWEVSYSTTSGDPDNGTIVTVTEKSYELTGLTAGTTYYASVRAVNSDEDKSAWSTEISFTPGVLTVNEGTQTNSYVPVYGGYTSNNVRSQFIIPASSLSSISGQEITKLVFYSNTASANWGNAKFDVYLKEVTNTTFSSSATFVDWTDMEKVTTGAQLSISGNQMVVTFDDAFEYNGGNLMIGINQTTTGTTATSTWLGVTSSYSAVYGYGTNTYGNSRASFLPKTSIYYQPVTVAPKLAVSATDLSYGLLKSTATDAEKQLTFQIQNKGKAAMTGVNVSYTGDAAISVSSVENATVKAKDDAAYEDLTVTVTINTETPGDYSGTITVSATGVDDATVNVAGVVMDPTKSFIDFADSKLPEDWSATKTGSYYSWSYGVYDGIGYAGYSGTGSSYTGTLTSQDLTFTAGEKVYFETARFGTSYNPSITVEESEDGTTWNTLATYTDDIYGTWTLRSVTVSSAAIKYIRFKGWYFYVTNIYGGQQPVGARFAINTDGSSQYFGMVEQEATAEKSYTITNNGNTALPVSFTNPTGFTTSAGNTVLFTNNNSWSTVNVYAWGGDISMSWPGIPATYYGTNDYGQGQYSYVLPAGVEGIIFNNGSEQTVDITNFDVEGYYLDGNKTDGKYNAATWGDAPAVLTVAAGGSESFTVKMNTETAGAKDGNVALAFNALNETSFTIPVTGYVMDSDLFTETFDGTTTPDGWENTGWTFADGEATGAFKSPTKYQLITPALTVAEGEKMAIEVLKTSYIGSATLPIYVSKDGGEFTLHQTISNSDLEYNSYKVFFIEGLTAGNYKIRFDADATKISAVNGFQINQNAPAFEMVTTGAAAFGKVAANAEKTYTVKNAGTGTLTVDIASDNATDFSVSPAQLNIAGDETADFTITFNYTEGSYGNKSANITVTPTYNTELAVTIAATARAINPDAWEEDFEEGTIPTTWENEGSWTVTTPSASGNNGTKMATISSYGNPKKLTTPRLQATAGDNLTFYIGLQYDDEPLTIEYSNDDKATWNVIEDGVANYTTSGDITFTAPEDGFYNIRFTGTYAMLDNFNGFKLALKEHDVAIQSQNIRSTFNQYGTYDVTVTVKEMVGKEETLTAKFFIDDTQYGDADVQTVEANGTQTFTVSVTLDEIISGDAYFTISNENISLTSDKVAVTTKPAIVLDETVEPDLSDISTSDWQDVVALKYTAKAGWNTICVPFKLEDADLKAIFGEGWKAYEFNSYSDGNLGFKQTTTFYAGYPYVIYSAAPATLDEKGYVMKVIQLSATSAKYDQYGDATFQGTYAPIDAPDMEGKYGVTPAGKIAKGGASASIKGFRAYFELPANANANLTITFTDEDGTVTRISGVEAEQLLNGGDIYDLSGRKMTNAQLKAGVYIVNGKKVVIKK